MNQTSSHRLQNTNVLRMRFGSGSYNVRASEGLNPSLLTTNKNTIECTVVFLDGTVKNILIDRNAIGQQLLDRVFSHLELIEKDFFGLQFICIIDTKDTQQKKWLDPLKSVRKQMICAPYQLYFKVKFYVSDPSKLNEEYTRYHYFLQLRQDISEGRLPCAEGSMALLASYAIQSEIGDFNLNEHGADYLKEFIFYPKQNNDFGSKVQELHSMHRGQTPAEAEYNFLDHAKRLDMYGVDLYEAKDGKGLPIDIGVNSYGMLVFHGGVKISEYAWCIIMKISFKKKQFLVQVRLPEEAKTDTVLAFFVNSSASCKLLWKSCIEHHTFFRLIAPPTSPQKRLFNLGSKFRYSGRTEFQTMEDVKHRARVERAFHRSTSRPSFARSTFSGTTSCDSSRTYTPTSPDVSSRAYSSIRRALPDKTSDEGTISRRDNQNGYPTDHPSVRKGYLSDSHVLNGHDQTDRNMEFPSLMGKALDKLRLFCVNCSTINNEGSTSRESMLKFAVGPWVAQKYGTQQQSERNTLSVYATIRSNRESSAPSLRRRQKETVFGVSEDDSEIERSWTPAPMQACTSTATPTVHHRSPSSTATNGARKSINGYPTGGMTNSSNGVVNGYVNGYNSGSYITQNNNTGAYSNGTLSRSTRISPRMNSQSASSPRSSVASYSSQASIGQNQFSNGSPTKNRRSPQSNKSNSPVGEDSLVTVRMRPDEKQRFGFNVKGGADQNYPVIVSRVAPGSSADRCHPRLNEGDQVLFINGRDVSTMAHDKVVEYIRSARTTNGGELVLTIKPNVNRFGEEIVEPESLFIPESARVSDTVPRSDKLSQSLKILSDSLQSGKMLQQFEQLNRKKPGLTMDVCKTAQNISKNRYRDVCPYDSTRVVLNSAQAGDYINANFVNMEIPASGIVNRYIACQGPLATTCSDFWIMVWEQLCNNIVMLTTTVERGRVKCHQYWPRLYESQEFAGRLTVTCIRERENANCSYREFSVKDRTSKEERRVTQMQYTAWPDHGVPDDPKHFIQFVDEVRRARAGSVDPIVVHCSAGIGRTGVLILMETASCLVEANEPIYPFDIVNTMRDQRAMLIQTPGQYMFVCESILRAYNDGIIKPLAEYQKR